MSVIKSIEVFCSEENSPPFLSDADRTRLRPQDVGAIASAVDALGSGAQTSPGAAPGVICLAAFDPGRLPADVRRVFQSLAGWESASAQVRRDSSRIPHYLVDGWLSADAPRLAP